MDFKKTGELLKSLRKAKGLTQNEVADALYVTQKTISRWETGEGIPDITIIGTVANYYDITVDELLNGEIKKESQSDFTIKSKEQKKGKLIFRKINNNLTLFLSISLGIGALFTILDLFIGLFANTIAASILGVIAIIATILIYLIGYKNIKNNYLDIDMTLSEKEKEKISNLFNNKNLLFYDLFSLIFLIISILYFIFVYIGCNKNSTYDYTFEEKIFFDACYLIILFCFYFIFRTNIKKGQIKYNELKPKFLSFIATLSSFSIFSLFNIHFYPEGYWYHLEGHYNSFLLFVGRNYGYAFRASCLTILLITTICIILFAKYKNNTGILISFICGIICNYISSFDIFLLEPTCYTSINFTSLITTIVSFVLIIMVYVKNHQIKIDQFQIKQ